MRAIFSALLLVVVATAAGADDVLGPADYMKIIEASKLLYRVKTEPAKVPIEELKCPRRDATARVVATDKGRDLVAWQVKPEALTLINDGEKLWDHEDYKGASEKYQAALEIDPQAVLGYFFYGDALLFGSDDAEAALVQYRKGIALDPTLPTGHLFAHTALAKLGRFDEAREEVIKALTYYPGYETVWKIAQHPERWNAKPVVRHKFEPPAGYLGKREGDAVDLWGGPDLKWLIYAICKAAWANERQFASRHSKEGWTTEEERACVLAQLEGEYNRAEQALEESRKNGGKAKPVIKPEDVISKLDPLNRHLWEVANVGLLDGYILFEIIGQHCPLGLATMSDETRDLIDRYIRTYVIVPAAAD